MGLTAGDDPVLPLEAIDDEHFRSIFETTPECLKLVAHDGALLHMNASGLAMLGAPGLGAVVGTCIYDRIAAEHRNAFREFNERICRGERGTLEFDMVSLTGTRLNMETQATPLRYSDGSIVQLAITRDVTERKRMEREALLLGAIVDSSEDAILSKDLNGVITSWNNSAERVFGYNAEEAVGKSVAELLIPADRQNEEPAILARLKSGERVQHFETRRRRKDGTLLDVSLTISPVKNSRGEIIGASKIARDITAQVRAQAALEQANAALKRSNNDLEQFAYSASHDLQEPLRMVSTYGELLRRRYSDKLDDDAREYLGYVIEGGFRMERLLSDLRAFMQASIGVDRTPPLINAGPVLYRALANLKALIDENGAEITCGPLPVVRMHEFQLEQIFQNVVGNAIRYRSAATPQIHVAAAPEGPGWKFSVQDNGIGVEAQYSARIFGIFKRLHGASEYPGTGMGLAICQRIVERAGGRIWVESAFGKGSTFFFILPGAESETL